MPFIMSTAKNFVSIDILPPLKSLLSVIAHVAIAVNIWLILHTVESGLTSSPRD